MITGDMGNKLNTYAIKDNSIGSYVFDGCASLTSIDLSNCLATTIDSAAFIGCTNLTSITLPSSLASIPNNEYGPFRNCTNLTTIKLPSAMFATDNNASIADEAFYNCPAIHEIYIPADAVAEFKNGSAAFNGCKTNGTI
jgi:hypothetical protein